MKADRNNYIKNYWYVNCIECDWIMMKYTIQALLNIVYLHQIDDENSNLRILKYLTSLPFMSNVYAFSIILILKQYTIFFHLYMILGHKL